MSLTEPQRAALVILGERTEIEGRTITARTLARALWPDSPAWQIATSRRGAGGGGAGVHGGTMPMKAGTLLGRLAERGVAESTGEYGRDWRITPLGVDVLAGRREPRPVVRPAREPVVRQPKPGRTS